MQRAKVDIKDFNPAALHQVKEEGRSWVAVGKHLCGAATDFTLRCCTQAAQQAMTRPETQEQPYQGAGSRLVFFWSPNPIVFVSGRFRGEGNKCKLTWNHVVSDGEGVSNREGLFKGLAIAPCCHHRCCWQHFVGKEAFCRMGFSPLDFEIISWMTGNISRLLLLYICFS